MSGYNFKNSNSNNNNYISNSNNVGHSNGTNHISNNNGVPAGYPQVDNEFLSRNLSSTNNHNNSDMSVQLTRPTSRIAMLVRQRRAMLEQISCFICKGYLIDATTIGECMDSFCKSCIVKYLRNNSNCPKCGTFIHQHDPLQSIKSDKVLQDIVYKMIPGLYDNEMRRRREFYKGFYGTGSTDEDDSNSSASSDGPYSGLSGEKYGAITYPKPFYKPSDSIDLSIEPQTRGDCSTIYYDNKRQSIVTCFSSSSQQRGSSCNGAGGSTFSSVGVEHFKTYLRCPARLTVLQLKKFIAAKFNTCRDDTIHLLYLNESLKVEYSLMDIAYIYDWRGIDHMRLFYIIERDLGKASSANEINQEDDRPRSSKITRQSVGISTQTVKRVCIDPQPQVYEVRDCVQSESSTSGRSMRSRFDSKPIQKSVRSTSTQVTQTSPDSQRGFGRAGRAEDEDTYMNGGRGEFERQTANSSRDHDRTHRPQPSYRGSNSSAIHDSSRPGESRSLRSQQTSSTSGATIPKINISLSSHDHEDKTRATQQNTMQANNMVAPTRTNMLVPHTTTKSFVTTNLPGRTESSLVTLASFTETNSNHVMSAMRSSAITTSSSVSDSYRGVSGSKTSADPQRASNNNNNDYQATAKSQSGPQLAFRFVTERGRITIVRRLNPPDEADGTSNNTDSGSSSQELLTSSRMSTTQSNSNGMNGTSSSNSAIKQSSHNLNSMQEGSGGSSQRAGDIGVTPRHQIKVKPVYKTFVDPTKLKSPNLKKLGFTAKH